MSVDFSNPTVPNFSFQPVYKSRVVQEMRQPDGFIDFWGGRHLSSNIIMTDSGNPLSNRFVVLEGIHSKLLVFGFIYHLNNPAPEVTVLNPAEVVEEKWFIDALRENPHSAVLIMAHMGTDDQAIQPILDAVRRWDGDDMPVQFVAGHTHFRRWSQLDPFASAVEAGRYLDTVGFISFPNADTLVGTERQDDVMGLFRHEFVDANLDIMEGYLNTEDMFPTADGKALTEFILRTKSDLGLDKIVGCSSMDYFMNRSLEEPDSLWAVYRDHVVPSQLEVEPGVNRAILISQASWRYDLFAGENEYDDIVAISPFNEPVFYIGALPCETVLRLNETMNGNMTQNYYQVLPAYILSGRVIPGAECELYTHHFELTSILDNLATLYPQGSFEVQTTGITSTTIWSNFFVSTWPCEGQKALSTRHPPAWNLAHEDEKTNKKNLVIVVASSLLVLGPCCWLGRYCWQTTKHLFFGYSLRTMNDELDTFNDEPVAEAESEFT